MRVGSLFAGIGGFDLAAERVGMEVVWQSELDPKASAVLAHHWPGVRNYGDIHDMGLRRHEPAGLAGSGRDGANREGFVGLHLPDKGAAGYGDLPAVDVLTGGFPCQDYSVAGTRGGLAGDRGALWWEYHRLIAGLRPTWVIGENVPGLLSSRDGADFETIVGSLTQLGYGVAWAVLDAQYFGVAQRRRRVFIVGHSGGEPRPEVLALTEGLFGHPEPSREAGSGVAALTANGLGGGGPDDNLAQAGHLVAFPWKAFVSDGSTPTLPVEQTLAVFNNGGDLGVQADSCGVVGVGFKQGFGTQPEESELVGGEGDGVFTHWDESTLPAQHVKAFAQNQRDEVRDLGDKAGALAAEPGMKQQTYVVGASVRRLTPLECERLQGFPDGWTATPGNSDTQRYRQLGNAVAVPVVEWLLRNVMEVDGV